MEAVVERVLNSHLLAGSQRYAFRASHRLQGSEVSEAGCYGTLAPSIVLVGARNEDPLWQNLGAVG